MTDTFPGRHVDPDGSVDPLATSPVDPTPTGILQPTPTPTSYAAANPPRRENVTCPECGQTSEVTLTRRDSVDFCPRCDFPLFWTPAEIQLGDDRQASAESLRRLPGMGGKVSVASTPCPHCREANTLNAVTCVRCGGTMVVEARPPVVVAAPAPPPPAPLPKPRTPWWVWVIGFLTAALVVALVAYALQQ